MELSERDQIESGFAARFARLNTGLRHRLEDYLGSPPDPSGVPEVFWQEVEDEMNRELAIVLLLIWSQSATQHGLAADLAQTQGLRYATARAEAVASQFSASTRDMLTAAGRRWSQQSPTAEAMQGDLVSILGPERAQRTAVYETTRAQTIGGEEATAQTAGLSALDTWFTRRDDRVCPVCQPLHKSQRSQWQAEFPLGPPAHIGCRCWIQYRRDREEVRL